MINISKLYCSLAGKSDHLRYNPRNNFGPIVVYNCTQACNLKCRHCYSSSDQNKPDQLSTAQALQIISDLKNANVPVLLFSGGEPLLRPDLLELLHAAKLQNLRTVISTNGTLINEQTAAKLLDAGLSYAGISLDGPEKVHDSFRLKSGAFNAAINGIKACQTAGLKAGIRFTITTENVAFIPEIFQIAVENGVKRICFYHLIGMGRATEITDKTPSPEITRSAVDTIIDKTKEYVAANLIEEVLTVGNHADGPYLLAKMAKENHPDTETAAALLKINGGNRIGEKIACISWDGSVYPDQFWRNYSLGNIKDRTFTQIWTDTTNPVLIKLRNKTQFADKRCLACKYFDLCKGNFRFTGQDPADENWRNEPACYLTDEQISS